MDQDHSHEESIVNLQTLPTELLVYIISFMSSLRDRVNLRYVSSWLKCVVEATPSLWKKFVWPYYCSSEERSVKEVLKACGQHVKILSFPYSKASLAEILQYCSNVKHLSLPSTKLHHQQLQRIVQHMRCLQSLELKVDYFSDIGRLFSYTSHLKEITLISNFGPNFEDIFKHWKENQFRPPTCNVIAFGLIECLLDHIAQPIPTGTTASFRVFNAYNKVSTLPFFQVQIERSGQVTTPCVKLSDFGILGLNNDVAVMTDCQYGGKTLYGVSIYEPNKPNLTRIAKPFNLKDATHFNVSWQSTLHSGHLEQLAIACPNLQRLYLKCSHHCLRSLQGLRAIASQCLNLQGLNLLGICVKDLEDHIQLWEILSDMKLTYLAVDYCILGSEASSKEKFICLLKKCLSIRAIELKSDRGCYHYGCNEVDTLILSYLTSLHYCYVRFSGYLPTSALDMINNSKSLKYVRIFAWSLHLNLAHNPSLQQLCIQTVDTNIPKGIMTLVSCHGGLVHVVMDVPSLTAEAITCLVRNSPKLATLYLRTRIDVNVECFNAILAKMFSKRVLFRTGYCEITDKRGTLPENVMQEIGTDLPI